jgi:hypothetical protein
MTYLVPKAWRPGLAGAATGARHQLRPHLLWVQAPRTLDWWIVSHGGVATTTILEFLKAHGNVNDPADRDGLKHLVRPPTGVRPRGAFIYVYGDPVLAVISLYVRGYAGLQARKNGHVSIRPIPRSVDDYASQGFDALRLTRHLQSWLLAPARWPVVFVDSRRLWDNSTTLLMMLGLDKRELTFPEKRGRRSDECALSERTRHSLTRLYAGYNAITAGLPPVLGKRLLDGMRRCT